MKKLLVFPLLLLLLALSAFTSVDAVPQDGQYTVEVTLSGGSGRSAIESPALLTVSDGAMTAVVVWSSPYYDFMLIDGSYYYPINAEGNSTFEIPVPALDEDLAVSAETVAMSEPHVIDYTLRFDSASLKSPGELTMTEKFLIAAAAIVVLAAAACLVVVLRRRGKGRKASGEYGD
jgi:hypothetical protein